MTWREIGRMAIHNLWQRRGRTALNLIGVVIGCIILLMTAAGAGGVSDAIHALFDSSEFARQIGVFSGRSTVEEPPEGLIVVEGEMTDERRERIREAMESEWRRQQRRDNQWKMTSETLEDMRQLPHVVTVVPEIYMSSTAFIDGQQAVGAVVSADPLSRSFRERVIFGEAITEDERDAVLIDEYFAYRLGFQSDSELNSLVGREIEIEYRIDGGGISNIYSLLTRTWGELSQQEFSKQTDFMIAFMTVIEDLDQTSLTEEQKTLIRDVMKQASGMSISSEDILVNRTFRVKGIVRRGQSENITSLFRRYFHGSSGAIYAHHEVATAMYLENPLEEEFYQALVTVDSTRNLREVTESIRELGAEPESGLWILENIDHQINHKSGIIYGVAAAILLTSAIGISNTLVISVLERTPEFGILKSLGAKDSELLLLMICEGGILGAVGAVVAIVTSWMLALVGHGILEWYVESEINSDLTTSLFQFKLLPAVGVLGVSILVCAGASILPAWRAARLDPIKAMRRT